MTSEKPGVQAGATFRGGESPTAEARILPTKRAGQSNAPRGAARTHTLVISILERPGSVDRVVGLLRRRRANAQTLTIGRCEQPDVARITVVTNDSEVEAEQLVEQLRKVVDVRQVVSLSSEQIVERELALIKVKSDPQHAHTIIELGHQFGAHIADVAPETVTLEVTGNAEKVEKLVHLLQPFGIREMARTGSVAMPRGTEENTPCNRENEAAHE
ncbi:MAG TPA: acetolactate synthase small subunit [Ktedonobacteraceae bacterium]|nr:acetolactate synthase small subunit [Ktedonobacteraceae bacterium]